MKDDVVTGQTYRVTVEGVVKRTTPWAIVLKDSAGGDHVLAPTSVIVVEHIKDVILEGDVWRASGKLWLASNHGTGGLVMAASRYDEDGRYVQAKHFLARHPEAKLVYRADV